MYRSVSILILFFILSIFIPNTLLAQALIGGTPLYLTINPENPSPEDFVTASIQSYSTDLNVADISWFVNNSLVKRGIGVKAVSFTLGKAGSQTNVSVVVRSSEGFVLEESKQINPAHVSLVWEADTYTPPFYKGKALNSHQGILRISALPDFINSNGTRTPASQLVYKWKQNGTALADASGYGKQTITLEGGVIIRPFTIDVEVTKPDSPLKGTATIVIASTEPKLLMYENSPAYGVRFSTALGQDFNLNKDEVTLVAIPYFFSVQSPEELKYTWLMNSRELGRSESEISFRNEAGVSGVSKLSVKAENILKFLQFGSQNTSIKFETLVEGGSIF